MLSIPGTLFIRTRSSKLQIYEYIFKCIVLKSTVMIHFLYNILENVIPLVEVNFLSRVPLCVKKYLVVIFHFPCAGAVVGFGAGSKL